MRCDTVANQCVSAPLCGQCMHALVCVCVCIIILWHFPLKGPTWHTASHALSLVAFSLIPSRGYAKLKLQIYSCFFFFGFSFVSSIFFICITRYSLRVSIRGSVLFHFSQHLLTIYIKRGRAAAINIPFRSFSLSFHVCVCILVFLSLFASAFHISFSLPVSSFFFVLQFHRLLFFGLWTSRYLICHHIVK